MEVTKAPNNWIPENRKAFGKWVDDVFKYQSINEEKKASCECDEDECDIEIKKFHLFPHQKFIRDYMQFDSPYRGLLLYHGLGVGKTCASIAAAEILRQHKDIVVMLPASLRTNYINEINKCGHKEFKTSQFWEFEPLSSKAEILKKSKETGFSDKFLKRNKGIWKNDYTLDSNYDDLSQEQQEQIDEHINELINIKYEFLNYNGIQLKHVKLMASKGNPFDNKVIIIDEVHNFISRVVGNGTIGKQ